MANVQFRNSKVLFTDDDKVAMHEDCCCPCVACYSGSVPSSWTLVLDGFADASCNECDEYLNDTFVLLPETEGSCTYVYSDDSGPCTSELSIILLLQAGELEIWVRASFQDVILYRYTWPDGPLCDVSDLAVPEVSHESSLCYMGGTCVATANA